MCLPAEAGAKFGTHTFIGTLDFLTGIFNRLTVWHLIFSLFVKHMYWLVPIYLSPVVFVLLFLWLQHLESLQSRTFPVLGLCSANQGTSPGNTQQKGIVLLILPHETLWIILDTKRCKIITIFLAFVTDNAIINGRGIVY